MSGQLLSALEAVAIGSPIADVGVGGSLFGQALVQVLAQGVDKLGQVLVPPAQAIQVSPKK